MAGVKNQPGVNGRNTRTTTMDSWDNYQMKTLKDILEFQVQSEEKLNKLRAKLLAETDKTKTKYIQKEIDEELRKHKKLIDDIDIEEQKRFKRKQKSRQQDYQKQLGEYKAYLKQRADLEDKQGKERERAEKRLNKKISSIGHTLALESQIEERRYDKEMKALKIEVRDEILQGGTGVGVKEEFKASMSKLGENLSKDIGKAFSTINNKINSMMDTYAKYQSSIDTRLQESGLTFTQMQDTLKSAVGASPYLKSEDLLTNLQSLVELGIASNVEQRAFLMTITDKVAQTFDANNATLLRIIRLQQNDSTAARMGLEAYLTRFLNNMVENTEYLNNTFDSVSEALIEASSQMNTAASTEFEYIVQKWLGALTGTGLSENTATGIAQALGMLGSGNVSGLSSSSLNNLLVMAASRAGLDYSKLLTNGLSAQDTNSLMLAMVQYMNEIGSSSSNVVRSQYAQTFGLNISDLTAAGQISGSLNTIYKNMLSYSGMYDELGYQLDQVTSRTHISEKLNNLLENAQFSLASNIAGNAALGAIWNITDLIQSVTGGINIPAISAFGTGIDLETTVENLMKLGIVGIGSLGMIGDVATGLSQSGSNFSRVLNSLRINSNSALISSNGKGIGNRSSGMSTSISSAIIANSSGEDISTSTINQANDEQAEKVQSMKEEDETSKYLPEITRNTTDIKASAVAVQNDIEKLSLLSDINSKITAIYELLDARLEESPIPGVGD